MTLTLKSQRQFVSAIAGLPQLYLAAAIPDDIAALVKEILEEFYVDGVDKIVSAELDEAGNVVGEFTDRVGLRDVKRFGYKISLEEVSYWLLNAAEVGEFSLAVYAPKKTAPAKKKNCKKGIACGLSCISATKICKKSPTAATKAKITKAKAAIAAATPAATPAKPKAPAATPAPALVPPTPPRVGVRVNEKKLKEDRAKLVRLFGEQPVADVEKNVQKILDDSGIYLKLPNNEVLGHVLNDGFKTAHELGGRPGPSSPDGVKSYLNTREKVEETVLGIPPGTPGRDRPKYAYIGSKKQTSLEHLEVEGAYGAITVELKGHIRDRTTFTGADSFKSGIASPITQVNAASLVNSTRHGLGFTPTRLTGQQALIAGASKTIAPLTQKLSPGGNAYMEAQIHGDLGAGDIAALHFRPTGAHDYPTPAIAQAAKAKGIDIYVNGKKIPHDQIVEIEPEKSIKKIRTALEQADFDKLEATITEFEAEVSNSGKEFQGVDKIQSLLAEKAGFAGKPTTVPSDQFEATAKGHFLYRGVNAAGKVSGDKIQEQFLREDYFVGNGAYGHGNYFSHGSNNRNGFLSINSTTEARDKKARSIAKSYASMRNSGKTPRIIRGAISAEANLAPSERVKDQQKALAAKIDAERDARLEAVMKQRSPLSKAQKQKEIQSLTLSYGPEGGGYSAYISQRITPTYTGGDGTSLQPNLDTAVLILSYRPLSGGTKYSFETTKSPEIDRLIRDQHKSKINKSSGEVVFSSKAEMQTAIETAIKTFHVNNVVFPTLAQAGLDAQVNEIKERARKIKRFYGLDTSGVSGRFATLMGIDGIVVSETTRGGANESSQYINILNRSKLLMDEQIYTPDSISDVKRPKNK